MDNVHLIWQIPLLLIRALLKIIQQILASDPDRPLKRRMGISLLQSLNETLTEEQVRTLTPQVPKGVEQLAKSEKLVKARITIPITNLGPLQVPHAVLHVLRMRKDSYGGHGKPRTVLYLHGGGYILPPNPQAQLGMALELAKSAQAKYFITLEYGLAPRTQYPGQLMQAVAALRLMLTSKGRNIPSEISVEGAIADEFIMALQRQSLAEELILLGDSAGGHLLLSVLAHMKSPSPYAEPLTAPARIKAALLLSPWVSMRYDAQSFTTNASSDVISKQQMLSFDRAWQPKRDEVWAELLHAAPTEDFWRSIFQGPNRLVNRTLLTLGRDEIFLDDGLAMMKSMDASQTGDNDVLAVVCRGEAHVGICMDKLMGVEGGQGRVVANRFVATV